MQGYAVWMWHSHGVDGVVHNSRFISLTSNESQQSTERLLPKNLEDQWNAQDKVSNLRPNTT